MNIRDMNKPATSKQLNETMAKKFGTKIDVASFTLEQLQDARNKIRSKVFDIETNESFGGLSHNKTYSKNKLFLDVLNTAIGERADIQDAPLEEAQSAAQKAAFQKMLDKKSGKDQKTKPEDKATKADSKPKDGKMPMDDNGTPGDKSDDKPAFLKKKKVKEGAEEQATLVMAAKDMVDRITGWMEDTAEMQTESMLELGDKIRDELGIDQSETFINTVKPALGSLFTSLESTRDSLTSGVAILTGEGAPSTMGDEVPADDMDMEPTVDADAEADAPEGDDEFAAADASVGGDEPDDRGKRESIELSKRLGLLLADSKKKD